jgi:hypothetical protein
MWAVKNLTPFETQGYLARDRNGLEHWVVALCASFGIRDDGLVDIADEQRPIRLAPTYVDDEANELLAETDIAPFRPRADFILHGVACLPEMAGAKTLRATVKVNDFEKTALVHGKRKLRSSGGRIVIDEPEAFAGIPLTWRNSLGGTDPFDGVDGNRAPGHQENPIGRGFTTRWNELPDGAELDLPLVEDAANPISIGKPLPSPFGFGAVQPHWRPRSDFAGTYDEAWETDRRPLLPDDFDDRFYQAAPFGQALPLKGGELVHATNLSPDGPFGFRLPQLIVEARTRIGRDRTDSRFRLICVNLDSHSKRLDMTWNMHLPCSGQDTDVEGSTVFLRQMSGVAK